MRTIEILGFCGVFLFGNSQPHGSLRQVKLVSPGTLWSLQVFLVISLNFSFYLRLCSGLSPPCFCLACFYGSGYDGWDSFNLSAVFFPSFNEVELFPFRPLRTWFTEHEAFSRVRGRPCHSLLYCVWCVYDDVWPLKALLLLPSWWKFKTQDFCPSTFARRHVMNTVTILCKICKNPQNSRRVSTRFLNRSIFNL